MVSKKVFIINEKGLSSRFVSSFIKKSISFKSNIILDYNGIKADAKSLINILALKVSKDSWVTVTAPGPDEEVAVNELVQLLTCSCN